jgi:hypothetical protein
MNPEYRWVTIGADRHSFPKTVFAGLGVRSLRVLIEASHSDLPIDRGRFGGLVLALGECRRRTVAVGPAGLIPVDQRAASAQVVHRSD